MTRGINWQAAAVQVEAEEKRLLAGKSEEYIEAFYAGIEFLWECQRLLHIASHKDCEAAEKRKGN